MSISGPQPLWSFAFPDYQMNTTAISDDGQTLLTGTYKYNELGAYSVVAFRNNGSPPTAWSWRDDLPAMKWGVNWVSVSGDGVYGAAGGMFVRAYSMRTGERLLDVPSQKRVNQLEFSTDGSWLVVASGTDGLSLYSRGEATFSLTDSVSGLGYLNSIAVSADGRWIVAGGELPGRTALRGSAPASDQKGVLYLYENLNGCLERRAVWSSTAGVLRVVMSRCGTWWATTTSAGTLRLYDQAYSVSQLEELWAFTPSGVGAAYGASIVAMRSGEVRVAMGANTTGLSGMVYLLDSVHQSSSGGYEPRLVWSAKMEYDPNPSMCLSADGRLLAVCDGEPKRTGGETPGNFYLFDAATGVPHWTYSTDLMNWGLAMNPEGTALFGGSDDGSVYYWADPAG